MKLSCDKNRLFQRPSSCQDVVQIRACRDQAEQEGGHQEGHAQCGQGGLLKGDFLSVAQVRHWEKRWTVIPETTMKQFKWMPISQVGLLISFILILINILTYSSSHKLPFGYMLTASSADNHEEGRDEAAAPLRGGRGLQGQPWHGRGSV